jgi:hypothetical protein
LAGIVPLRSVHMFGRGYRYCAASKEPLNATRSLEMSGIPRPVNELNLGTSQCVAGSFYLSAQSGTHLALTPDTLARYGAAKREILPGVDHRPHRGWTNRAENSHQPTRRRERLMKRFKSARQGRASSRPTIRAPISSVVLPTPTPLIIAVLVRGPSRSGLR